ncbi:MAG: Crp/Fnr family transcriptional regulator [Phycisphaerae bacterium]|nr:Crp/Fnr family transcriptional regulator [Phycisphaerae bacterium]
MSDSRAVLRQCGLFGGLKPASLEKVAGIARAVRHRRGTVVFREGDECPGIYVVAEGAVRIYKIAPNGKEHVLHFARPGSTFAEVAAIGGFPCPAYAEAVEDSASVLVPQVGFRQIMLDDHAFCIEMMTGMSLWVHRLVGLLEDLVLRDATARVAHYLLQTDKPEAGSRFTLPMRKRDLASHLNLTSETLSRTLRRLLDCGLIDLREQDVEILNNTALEAVAHGLAPAEFA